MDQKISVLPSPYFRGESRAVLGEPPTGFLQHIDLFIFLDPLIIMSRLLYKLPNLLSNSVLLKASLQKML